MNKNIIKSTTIIGIRKNNNVVIAGDGQASLGNTIMKPNVKKVRRLGSDNLVIASRTNSFIKSFGFELYAKSELWKINNSETK